eukprot:sb/3475015/
MVRIAPHRAWGATNDLAISDLTVYALRSEVIGTGRVIGEYTYEYDCELDYYSYESGTKPAVSWTMDKEFVAETTTYKYNPDMLKMFVPAAATGTTVTVTASDDGKEKRCSGELDHGQTFSRGWVQKSPPGI